MLLNSGGPRMRGSELAHPHLEAEEYRCHPAIRYPMGNSEELLYLTLKKEARVLGHAEANLLGLCSNFASLSAHANNITKTASLGAANLAAIIRALHHLTASGLMLTAADLIAQAVA